MIEDQYITEKLSEFLGPSLFKTELAADVFTVTVEAKRIHETLAFLRDTPGLEFGFLTDLCGVHYPDRQQPFEVVYHMHNMRQGKRLRIKAALAGDAPVIQSVTDLFAGANWMERETYDFYGIVFEGHPNLTRILNVDYLDYFPMRKEYPLEDPTREDKDNRFFGREDLI